MSSKKKKTSRKELIVEAREKQWSIPPSSGIPTYNAENDKNCPVGRIGNYNRKQKQKIAAIPDSHKTAEWIKQKLDRKYDDIPLKVHVNLSKKALDEARGTYDTSVTRPSPAEVEILQKVIVRERLIGELTRLLRSGSDVMSIMGEVVELIKAIRYETVDIVEDISNWQAFQPTPRPFLYKGMNYLIKVSCDFDFLDNYDEIVERFCFEFKSNPFAYKGGGNVITGAGPKNSERYLQGLLNSYYEGGSINVDGIEVARLHNAEKIIQGEFNRLAEQGNINLGLSQSKIPDALQLMHASVSVENGHETTTGENALKQSRSSPAVGSNDRQQGQGMMGGDSMKKTRPSSSSGARKNAVFSQKKVKLERIATLQSEVDELMAIMSHITEKIATLTADYQDRVKMYRAIEGKMIEARNTGKEAAMQHCIADLVVRKAALVDITNKVKELQREHYFVGLEKKRKQGVIRTVQNEIDEEKRKLSLKKKIEEVIKTKGLVAALDLINMQKEEQQQFVNKAGATQSSSSGKLSSTAGEHGSKKLKKKKAKNRLNGKLSGTINSKSQQQGRYDQSETEEEGEEEEEEEGEEDGDEDGDEVNQSNLTEEDDYEQQPDPFADYTTSGNINFGETFSSQQMHQMQGLNVERIDEGQEDEEEEDEDGEEGEEEESGDEEEESGDEEEEEEEDEDDGGNEEEKRQGDYQPPGIDGAETFFADANDNVSDTFSSSSTALNKQEPSSAPQTLPRQQRTSPKKKAPMSKDEQLAHRHQEELAYMRQLQEELTLPTIPFSADADNANLHQYSSQSAHEDIPTSARSSRSVASGHHHQHGHKVGYISDEEEEEDEEEGEEEEEDDNELEVSADMSTAPVGSGFQVAKALKSSPRPN